MTRTGFENEIMLLLAMLDEDQSADEVASDIMEIFDRYTKMKRADWEQHDDYDTAVIELFKCGKATKGQWTEMADAVRNMSEGEDGINVREIDDSLFGQKERGEG